MGTQTGRRTAHRWMVAGFALLVGVGPARAIGPHDARSGEECRAQVNAQFDAVEAKMAAHGNYDGIAVTEDHDRGPALLACERFEHLLQQEQLSVALERLSSATEILRAGHVLTPATISQLAADRAGIEKLSPRPYRHEYLLQYEDYRRYLSVMPPSERAPMAVRGDSTTVIHRCGTPEHPVFSDRPCGSGEQVIVAGAVPAESCPDLRRKLADSRRAYDQAAAALVAGADVPGEGWRTAEAQRRKAMSDMRWYADRARLLGCAR